MSALAWYARFLLVVIAAQFYAAGLAVFGATSFTSHALIGWSFMALALLLAIWAGLSKSRRTLLPIGVAVLLLAMSQPVIVFGLRPWPAVAAVHPLVGLLLAALLWEISRRAQRVASPTS